jgi:putative ABC transport system permease protein
MNPARFRFLAGLARRDLAPRLRGLRLLFVCIFLGVATLATIGSLTAAITSELAAQGREILGGDVEVAIAQRRATAEEIAAFGTLGRVSETIRLRAMANRIGGPENGPRALLAELKGVDTAYPLYGKVTLAGGARYRPLGPDDLLIDETLAGRLGIAAGDLLRYGEAGFRVRAIIAEEPDRVGEGFTLGPVAIVSLEGLERTRLIQPGSLYESKYRIRLPPGANPDSAIARLKEAFPSAGFELKDRDGAAPGANRFFDRMGQFLTLVGLTALIVAGIGVGNGVTSYLAMKQSGIATLKVMGATSTDIARIYLLQIGAIALLAGLCGLAAGAVLPLLLIGMLGDLLPVRPGASVHPLPLAVSAAYGLLIAFVFTLPPLARAKRFPTAALFRTLFEPHRWPGWRTGIVIAIALLAILALAAGTSDQPMFALSVIAATAGVLLLLLLVGWLLKQLAARLPRPRRPLLRLALANLHRPGAQTIPLVVALGLGLSLFVTLAGIQTSMDAEISRSVPRRAPNQFVLDIPVAEEARFRSIVRERAPEAKLNVVPSLRGSIVAFGGKRVADLDQLPEGAWFLQGDRGLTYSEAVPEGSDLVRGSWWPRGYLGPPLVSLDQEVAKIMGVDIGDHLTISLLGREIDVRVASLRRVNWDTMGFNYIMVFSPNTLRDAPHQLTATITMNEASEAGVARGLLGAFPSISVIDVGEVIGQVRTLLDQMALAIALAASVTILAGMAVLVGAIAASRQARSYDSVILKTLGASRRQILGAQAIEYALLAALLALISFGLGTAAAWFVIVEMFDFGWAPDWPTMLATLGAGAALTLGIGLIGSIPIISIRPAAALREIQLA